jgi:hypothetical protein
MHVRVVDEVCHPLLLSKDKHHQVLILQGIFCLNIIIARRIIARRENGW